MRKPHRAGPTLFPPGCSGRRQVRNPRRRLAGTTSTFAIPGDMASSRPSPAYDRVVERRRAVALAWHFREADGLSIAQIADRLGRSPATVKAYFYDPSDANKGPSWEREARARRSRAPESPARRGIARRRPSPTEVFLRSAGCPALPVGLGFSCSTGSRNGAARRNSPATTETRRVCRSPRSLVGWDAQKQPSRRISTIRTAIRHARSRRATGECVAAAGRSPRHGTARATPTRIATLPSWRDCAAMDPGTGSRSDARMASALRRCAVVLRLVAHPRTPARRRGAQTTTSRRMARAVHCHRSVRELGGGRRGRLRRLSVRASMPLTYECGLALDRL